MVKIITDTTSGLPQSVAKRYDIPVIPQVINFGNESYFEGVDIDNATFLARLKVARELPKTAAPPPELFVKEFERLVPLGETILCIHPSAIVSGTTRSAEVAAKDFPDADIRILDTLSVGSPLATMVELAAEWAAAGQNADAIMMRLQDMIPRARIYFLVSTLEYLAKGGRIGGASALLGSVLQIKPILSLRNGGIETYEKERTYKNALARLKQLVIEQYPKQGDGYLSIMHAAVPDQAQEMAGELGQKLGVERVPILDVPPAIVTHGGPGLIAAAFFAGK
jgi:DegV family protein with EDD domain